MRKSIAVYALMLAALINSPAMANTNYFFEGIYSGGQGNVTVDDTEVDFDQATVDLTINFGSVNTANIPHSEAAFLNRSSFFSFRQTRLGSDNTEDQTTNQASARYVLRSGLFLAAVGSVDADNDEDNTYEVQIGQYTSDHTAVFAGYIVDEADGADVFTAGIRHTSPYRSELSWIAYDFGGRYLIEGDDNEFAVNFGMAYYPSFRSTLGFLYEYADGRLTDSHETNVFGEYFFSKYISTRVDATLLRLADIEEQSAALSLRLRF